MEPNYYVNPKSATLAATYNATISASTAITLNTKTVAIIVTAIDKGIFLRWNGTVSSSAFDEFIGVGQTRQFIVPGGTTTANFIQESATGKLVVVEK